MKSLITSICLLIPLVVVFIIIDRKDFFSGDDVVVQEQTAAREKTTTATTYNPVENPTEAKPVGTKPAETKPVEVKPVEMKPAEIKPVAEIKLAETNPLAEEKPVPAAIPVITAEESVNLNKFAFFLANVKKTVVEGEIVERSELPDPQKSDYPNCRFTVHFNGNSIKSGEPCPKEIVLVVEGFSNYKVLAANSFATGDKIECSIIPFDTLTEEYRSTQQADDLNLFLLDNYYVTDIRRIDSFTDNAIMPKSGILFSDGNEDYVSIYERKINPPISPEAIKSQEKYIEAELKKMEELLKDYDETRIKEINTDFSMAWKNEKEKEMEGYNRLGTYVWRNVDNSFWCLPVDYNMFIPNFNKLAEETLDCFSALKEACETNGVQLIVALVPNNYVISSRIINEKFRNVPDIQMATYVRQLSEIGIEAVYTADSVIHNYNRFEFAYNYPLDNHPADTTQDVITDLIAKRVERYEFNEKLDPSRFSVKDEHPHHYLAKQDYCFPENCDIAGHHPGDKYLSRHFFFDNNKIPNSSDAPLLIVGNSFIESPVYPSQSMPSILSYKTLSPVNWRMFYLYGPFTELLTQLITNPNQFLSGKKVLIYYFGVEHLSTVNNYSTMLNIKEINDEFLSKNNKKMLCSFSFSSNTGEEDEKAIEKVIGILSQETVVKIDDDGEWTKRLMIDSERLDPSKPAVCIIVSASGVRQLIELSVGDQTIIMRSSTYAASARLFHHYFDIPPGTKEITISAKGKKGSLFAIKDVQIWQ